MKYKVGDKVRNIVQLVDDRDNQILKGTVLRIVAITPKVRIYKMVSSHHDRLPDFFNAVVDSQTNDYENRIRANFCTIEKAKK